MKKISLSKQITVAFTALLICFTGMAQEYKKTQLHPPTPNTQQIEKMVTKLTDRLALSKKQSSQIETLYTVHFTEVESKAKKSRPNKKEMQLLRHQLDSNIKLLLTEEQPKGYDAYIRYRKDKRGKPQRK